MAINTANLTNVQLRKKILLCLSSSHWGGGEKHVYDIVSSLKTEYDFQVIIQEKGELYEAFQTLGIPILLFPLSSRFHWAESKKYLELIKKENYNLIHCHLNAACLQFSFLRPWLHCPLLATVHGLSGSLSYQMPDYLIAVSQAVYNNFLPWQKKKSCCIYNGINFMTPYIKPLSTNTDNLQAFVFATIHPNKGQEFLLKALLKETLKIKLTFVGHGQPKNIQTLKKKLENHPAKENICFIENHARLDKFWPQADFVIIPSYKEALSYVAIESLSRGIPVMAADTGGLKEIINQENHGLDGFLFKTGNIADFNLILHKMIKNISDMRQHLQIKPFLQRRPEFQIDSMLSRLKAIYSRLL